jgi:hypothetical protein
MADMVEPRGPQPREITTTNPDPSIATTESLLREIAHSKEFGDLLVRFVREVTEEKICGVRDVLETRTTHLEHDMRDRPAAVEKVVSNAMLIMNEKLKVMEKEFDNVQVQFKERDTRDESKTKDAVKAIDAAFQSADKAITKTETGFKDQIAEQGKRIDTVSKSADDKYAEAKERIAIIETQLRSYTIQKADATTATTQSTASTGLIAAIAIGVVSSLIALGSLIVALARANGVH